MPIHLICDNYATHKHRKVQAWAKRNPRFHFHFTPTSASWLNMVERFFRSLNEKALKRGSFYNVDDLTRARRTAMMRPDRHLRSPDFRTAPASFGATAFQRRHHHAIPHPRPHRR
jgi:transposase